MAKGDNLNERTYEAGKEGTSGKLNLKAFETNEKFTEVSWQSGFHY
jgi:hypothetical protein